MLTAAELGALLKPPLRAVVVERAESTNTSLMRMAATGAAEGTVLLALSQSAGRGQRGRTFYSPAGCGLYMSLLLRPRMRPEDALAVTPAAAVAAAQAIEAAAGRPAGIKWVNDIQIEGKKVCGILTESASSAGSLDCIVCGIGIDLCQPPGGAGGQGGRAVRQIPRRRACGGAGRGCSEPPVGALLAAAGARFPGRVPLPQRAHGPACGRQRPRRGHGAGDRRRLPPARAFR